LPIGAPLPKGDILLQDVSGKMISLKQSLRENGLLVMFSCNTCPVVIENQSRTITIGNYALGKEVGVVLLNSNEANRRGAESPQAMKEYATEQGYKFSYAVDKNNELADAFGANRTPECFLFDKQGKLVYHGAIDDNPQDAGGVQREHLKHAIDELVSGKNISMKKTRSVGCSIKRG
jgi:cytochrome oxidase Cu insertion factor (SCO1/SenC/PrrC family)